VSPRRLAAALLVVAAVMLALGVAVEDGGEEAETFLGIDVESTTTIVIGVAVSLAVALGLWLTGRRVWAALAVLVAFCFAVLDLAELAHQVDESKAGLAVLAAVIAAAHLVAALCGAVAFGPDPDEA
jgi:hypothetical protein